jgi:hypothetical protein
MVRVQIVLLGGVEVAIDPGLMTMAEAAEYLRITETSVRAHILKARDGLASVPIPYMRIGAAEKGSFRFRKSELDAWLKECANNGTDRSTTA